LKRAGARRIRIVVAAMALVLVSLAIVGPQYVRAPPPSSTTPYPLSGYGVARISVTGTLQGTTSFAIHSDGSETFFVVRVLIILNKPADSDIVLDSINIDGTGIVQVSGYSAATKVVIVSAGNVVGELITSMPTQLAFLLVKEPLGNTGIAANGGDQNGFSFALRYWSSAYYPGTTITAIALVTAPINSTITMTMSQ
jgi:hypothetical protein